VRVLLFFFLLLAGLYFGKPLLVPLSLGALFAFLLLPLTRRFERWGLPRIVSIFLCILLVFLIFGGVFALLSSQVISFANHIPEYQEKISGKLSEIQLWLARQTGINPDVQIEWARRQANQLLSNSSTLITSTVFGAANTFAALILIPVYAFFFLQYREKYRIFVFKVTPEESHPKVDAVITNIGEVAQQYLMGVFTVILILSVLNSTALWIMGIPYALFLGVLTSILSIVPYIGTLMANFFATLVAFLTKDSLWSVAGVLFSFWLIQMVENNILTPGITGSRVSLNPMAALLALMLGSLVWGVVGMVLCIPFLGIFKVICDSIERLRPYGYLLGTEDTDAHSPTFGGAWRRVRHWLGMKDGEITDER
jgi:predicted PurR-regulated permease PerM